MKDPKCLILNPECGSCKCKDVPRVCRLADGLWYLTVGGLVLMALSPMIAAASQGLGHRWLFWVALSTALGGFVSVVVGVHRYSRLYRWKFSRR